MYMLEVSTMPQSPSHKILWVTFRLCHQYQFVLVVYFSVIFNNNVGANPLLQLGTNLQFIIHVDIFPNLFPSPTQHPMGVSVLVIYSKVRPILHHI